MKWRSLLYIERKKIGKPRLEIEDIKHVFSIDLGGFIAADDEI